MVVTVNPVQEPVTVQAMAAQEPIQATTVQTPVTVQTTPANASPPSSILRSPPPTVEAPSATRKRKRTLIRFVNYLEQGDRPSRSVFAELILTSIPKKRKISYVVRTLLCTS